jgi:hypothetical protein
MDEEALLRERMPPTNLLGSGLSKPLRARLSVAFALEFGWSRPHNRAIHCTRFRKRCCYEEQDAFAAIVKIGEEDVPWFEVEPSEIPRGK